MYGPIQLADEEMNRYSFLFSARMLHEKVSNRKYLCVKRYF
jgi:hypothetical protein